MMKRDNINNIQNLLLNMVENNKYMTPEEMRANMTEVN
jgi:hypothetical protein